MPKKVGAAAVSRAGKPDDRTAPYTVPMKVVPQQCGPLWTLPSSTFGLPRCVWTLLAGCSCAHAAAPRSCFAAAATGATATAAGRAGACRVTLLGATAQAGTSNLDAAGLSMPSDPGAGASVARPVMAVTPAAMSPIQVVAKNGT